MPLVDGIFREEALNYRSGRLHGNVNIAIPVAWQLIGFLLIGGLLGSISFLVLASYSRVENVPGQIVLDRGVANIVPSRPGVVLKIMAAEGQLVRSGQKLAVVRSEESMIAGATAPERLHDALIAQDARLADQSILLLGAATADQARLRAQIDGDKAALLALGAQIADQNKLIAAAQVDYDRALEVASRGYISKRDMDERQSTILTRSQQLAQLQLSLSEKQSEIKQAERAIAQSAVAAKAQVANTESGRAALAQQEVQADLARGYVLTAPVDGVVTALTARLGQLATIDQPLMMIVPSNAQPKVELYVPTSAAGFLALGQAVRLSVDAFPYQTFGTLAAHIASISKVAVPRQTKDGPIPVFLVVAVLDKNWVPAFGRRQFLLAGMTLSARIVTERRSLMAWLFEPLFAMRTR